MRITVLEISCLESHGVLAHISTLGNCRRLSRAFNVIQTIRMLRIVLRDLHGVAGHALLAAVILLAARVALDRNNDCIRKRGQFPVGLVRTVAGAALCYGDLLSFFAQASAGPAGKGIVLSGRVFQREGLGFDRVGCGVLLTFCQRAAVEIIGDVVRNRRLCPGTGKRHIIGHGQNGRSFVLTQPPAVEGVGIAVLLTIRRLLEDRGLLTADIILGILIGGIVRSITLDLIPHLIGFNVYRRGRPLFDHLLTEHDGRIALIGGVFIGGTPCSGRIGHNGDLDDQLLALCFVYIVFRVIVAGHADGFAINAGRHISRSLHRPVPAAPVPICGIELNGIHRVRIIEGEILGKRIDHRGRIIQRRIRRRGNVINDRLKDVVQLSGIGSGLVIPLVASFAPSHIKFALRSSLRIVGRGRVHIVNDFFTWICKHADRVDRSAVILHAPRRVDDICCHFLVEAILVIWLAVGKHDNDLGVPRR